MTTGGLQRALVFVGRCGGPPTILLDTMPLVEACASPEYCLPDNALRPPKSLPGFTSTVLGRATEIKWIKRLRIIAVKLKLWLSQLRGLFTP